MGIFAAHPFFSFQLMIESFEQLTPDDSYCLAYGVK